MSKGVTILETPRLALREARLDDAPFILQLVNEPAWLRHIGDRGIRTLEAARDYILNVLGAMYREHRFGLWLVEHKENAQLIGMCGLIKRPVLADVDLGFAFLAEYHRQGYALEAAQATIDHARATLSLARLLAIVSFGNEASLQLLAKLGFEEEAQVQLSEGAPVAKLLAMQL